MTAQDEARAEFPGVFDTAGMSWVILGEAVEAMPSLFASGIIVNVLVNLVASRLLGSIAAATTLGTSSVLGRLVYDVCNVPVEFCSFAVLAAMAIPIHRLVLRDEKSDDGVSLFSRRTLHFALWLMFFHVCSLAVSIVGLAVESFALLLGVTTVFMLAGSMFVAATRCSLLFPAVALDLPSASMRDQLMQAWSQSRGWFWRLFGSSLLAFLPLVIGTGVLVLVLNLMFGAAFALSKHNVHWQMDVVSGLLQPIGAALGAAVLSWNYRFATTRQARAAS